MNRMIGFTAVLLVAGWGPVSAEPLEKLAKRLEKEIKAQDNKKVAVLSFPYHDGAMSSGSSIVQERLTTFLAQSGKVEVIERNLLKKVLEEKKLGLTGLIDAKTTSELGKVLGVGALVTGTLNDVKEGRTEVNARVIQADTGKILAAGQVLIERSWSDSPVQTAAGDGGPKPLPTPPHGPFLGKSLVQLAVLLDTSNSMDGLIHQAKTQLWKIVNELVSAEKSGASPTIQVALYEYGNSGLSPGKNYIRQVLPFTSNLDNVSEHLFALSTNGGEEYAGAVIQDAVRGLEWDKHTDVYKAIFIAGNEPFTQGPVDFRRSVAAAARKGIAVNTIFCGSRQEGAATQWLAGAQAGGGEYMHIDHAAPVAAIRAPQDDEIQKLGYELNGTFIPYGARGKKAYDVQAEQDANAAAAPASGGVVQRALFKASRQYADASASWDAVSEVGSGRMAPEALKAEELPEPLRKMGEKERKAYIEAQVNKRKEIQAKINSLNEARRKYMAEKEKELAGQGGQTLDGAVISAVRGQASKKGYAFK